MIRLPPRSKRPYTRFPYTTLLRSVAAMAASPGIGGVDVLQHLLVGRLGHDGADQLLEIGDLGRVTMAGEQVGRDGMIARLGRSEEHTSELQSLMRISYAVFCLKKKTTNTNLATTQNL